MSKQQCINPNCGKQMKCIFSSTANMSSGADLFAVLLPPPFSCPLWWLWLWWWSNRYCQRASELVLAVPELVGNLGLVADYPADCCSAKRMVSEVGIGIAIPTSYTYFSYRLTDLRPSVIGSVILAASDVLHAHCVAFLLPMLVQEWR